MNGLFSLYYVFYVPMWLICFMRGSYGTSRLSGEYNSDRSKSAIVTIDRNY